LELPAEVLTAVMRKKQRYFTVMRSDGQGLLPYFVTVRNGGSAHADEVRKGNEDVVHARFADAAYFFRQDLSKPLEAYLPRLATITFQAKLGSMLDKARRIEALVAPIGQRLGATDQSIAIARKAARLCKADLATSMVVEITALQGVMGREYHRRTSSDPDREAVAEAIFEHYLPRFAGDATPKTEAGLIVSLADKLDSIAGLFAVGLPPKGSADPFALRRAAIGIVQNLLASDRTFSLRDGLAHAIAGLPVPAGEDVAQAAHHFILERERQHFLDEGHRHDVVNAVVDAAGDDPARALRYLLQLREAISAADWPATLAAYARCARLVRSQPPDGASPGVDAEPASQALAQAVAAAPPPQDVHSLVANLRALAPLINRFFDQVLVMADDPALRAARLALLRRIVAQADGIADLSKLEGF
jgi:glycyl-tRNA synthetase